MGSQVAQTTKEVVAAVVSQRWSSDSDLVDAIEILGAQSAFMAASGAGTLDRVESDIFHFGRAVDASAQLQMTLTDPAQSAAVKAAVVKDLLAGKVDAQASQVIAYFASNLRGRRVAAVIDLLSELAAGERNQVVAQVRSVIALDETQKTRLATALSKLTGKQVSVNVAIDPSVIGGISVKIGQDVIDGSVATRLESARRSLQA
ncbi:MAG: F0F1 ATP synthase subunit delta [Actinobacteria bacterium]|nr:F0F1 ATP synthase subunit delta [Actinomycetota bacterium]